jgi:hypothetical protein
MCRGEEIQGRSKKLEQKPISSKTTLPAGLGQATRGCVRGRGEL